MNNFKFASLCYKLFGNNFQDGDLLNSEAAEVKDMDKEEKDKFNTFASAFLGTRKASINPISAFVGGVVSQEIVKAITKKFMPIKQEFYFDALELYEQPPIDIENAVKPGQKRYKSYLNCFG